LANGIWLFLVDWGITIGERAQRLTGYACIGLVFSCCWLALMLRLLSYARRTAGRNSLGMTTNGIKIAIVGGGLAGLAAAMRIAEAGHAVDLFSWCRVKRSHSVCAQGGINGAVNTKAKVILPGNISTTPSTAATFLQINRRQKPCARWRLDHFPFRSHGRALLPHQGRPA